MGVILDSSVLITGKRRRDTVRETLKRVRTVHEEIDCALSVVTVVELNSHVYHHSGWTTSMRVGQ
jgi:hypothetical protein